MDSNKMTLKQFQIAATVACRDIAKFIEEQGIEVTVASAALMQLAALVTTRLEMPPSVVLDAMKMAISNAEDRFQQLDKEEVEAAEGPDFPDNVVSIHAAKKTIH